MLKLIFLYYLIAQKMHVVASRIASTCIAYLYYKRLTSLIVAFFYQYIWGRGN